MTEIKRFTMEYSYHDEEYVYRDNGKILTPSQVLHLLDDLNDKNKFLSDFRGFVSMEHQKLKEENKELKTLNKHLKNELSWIKDYAYWMEKDAFGKLFMHYMTTVDEFRIMAKENNQLKQELFESQVDYYAETYQDNLIRADDKINSLKREFKERFGKEFKYD